MPELSAVTLSMSCGMQMILLTLEQSDVDQDLFVSAVCTTCSKFARWFMNKENRAGCGKINKKTRTDTLVYY